MFFLSSNEVWASTSNTVILNSYSEDKYTAVVKNLVINGFEVTNTEENYVGTVIYYVKDLGVLLELIKDNIIIIVVCIVLALFIVTYS